MTLSDDDVNRQIDHMIAFIKNESQEKIEEIYAKADEEFQIEKGRLVNQQRIKIIDFYEKKEKTLEQQKRLQQSKFINVGRLEVLKARESHVQNLMEAGQKDLLKISQDKKAYKEMLEKLIIQSCFQLLEDKIYVICRECDKATVEGLLDNVEAAYKAATGSALSISVHPSKSLPKDCAGGINLCNIRESITISNTLEARLDMLAKANLPQMRETLFGSNPNRKFKD